MGNKIIRSIPLNRVEGDLEIKVEINDGVVTDAWSSGTMFRGFERILPGRGALDGLVITPRVCGLCNVCHLTAAARALDMITGASIPPDATRVRNVCLMAEHVQSDLRHAFLLFAADFANPAYQKLSLYPEAVRRYAPLQGESVVQTVKETKKVLEIIGLLGGQWPHSSFMVPGGIASIPGRGDILQARQILAYYRKWYEKQVLGCSLERWREVRSAADLEKWLAESDAHRHGDLGFYLRFAREAGLDQYGKGHGKFISYGCMDMPEGTQVVAMGKGIQFVPSGFAAGKRPSLFDQHKIAEHVAYSWFEDHGGAQHPSESETRPYATGNEAKKYSWVKAPRYDGEPAETGPLAEMVIGEDPLFVDLLAKQGPNVLVRELARLVRPTHLLPAMDQWLQEIKPEQEEYYKSPGERVPDGKGFGLVEAARGALGHWVEIRDGKIANYQIITPTAWNASPRDGQGVRGPWEEALIGAPVKDTENVVELGHVVRSYDSCMVCSVHTLAQGGKRTRLVMK